jgi:NIMA (never in mitosis gene a)-related kinase
LTSDGNVKIGDFGLSKELPASLRTICGTKYYKSPEMVKEESYSHKTDVWSMGVMLYEMCERRYPFMDDPQIKKGTYPAIAGPYSQELKNIV